MSINEDIIEISPIKININDIFDKKVELGPLLQFNLLQKIIEEFINRQKKADDKINELEIKLNKINFKGKNVDISINSEFDEENDINRSDYDLKDIEENKNKENINNEDEKNNDDKILDNNNDRENVEYNKEIIEENNLEKNEFGELNNINININDSTNQKSERKGLLMNQNKLLNQLQTKINKLEIKYNELIANFSSLNKQNKKDFQIIRSKNNEYGTKIANQEKLIKELSEKFSEFDIYDLFKGDSNDVNIDKATILIKGIDQKLTKKIEFSDMRNKKNEEMIFKLKNDFTDVKNSYEAFQQLSKSMKENYNKLTKDTELQINLFKKKYDEISNLKDIIDNSVSKTDLVKFTKEYNQKLNDLIPHKNGQTNGNAIKVYPDFDPQSNNISEDLKSYLNKNLEIFEKKIKDYINDLNIDSINKEVLKIQEDLAKKINKENLSSINKKIRKIESTQDDLKLQIDENKNDIFCCNDKCSKAIRMVENLRGQMLNLKKEEEKKDNDENVKKEENDIKKINIDLSDYITKENFDEELNKIFKKIEKISNLESDNYRNIQSIEGRLKYFASENDLTNIEQYLINLIDEYKIKVMKKFVDKIEYQKSFKYLEVQIKQLQDINSKDKDNENWLLAKKPINNYMCASCEAYLGELKNKEEYSAWNKIPMRDDYNKRYRLGHGFSKMLKMVNMDLLKKVTRTNSGINIGIKIDESKKINLKNLPKINIQNQIDNSINNINFNSEENIEKNNNSADNIENSNEITEPVKSERNENSERLVNKSTNINNSNISFINIGNNDDGKPKLIKIYKKNKK